MLRQLSITGRQRCLVFYWRIWGKYSGNLKIAIRPLKNRNILVLRTRQNHLSEIKFNSGSQITRPPPIITRHQYIIWSLVFNANLFLKKQTPLSKIGSRGWRSDQKLRITIWQRKGTLLNSISWTSLEIELIFHIIFIILTQLTIKDFFINSLYKICGVNLINIFWNGSQQGALKKLKEKRSWLGEAWWRWWRWRQAIWLTYR